MKRYNLNFWRRGGLLVALLASLLIGPPAGQAGTDSWTIESSPDPTNYLNTLYAVAAPGANNVWAVGTKRANANADYENLVVRWDGTSWFEVQNIPNPGSGSNYLYGVTALNASTGWAVGTQNQSLTPYHDPLTLRTTNYGATWQDVSISNPGTLGYLYGVAGTATNDVWTVGSYNNPTVPMIRHWDGTSWSTNYSVTNASNGVLRAVVANTGSDAWAVGSYPVSSVERVLVAHWNGTSWSRDTLVPGIQGSYGEEVLEGVTITPDGKVWAVGHYDGGTQFGTLPFSLWRNPNTGAWTPETIPNPFAGGTRVNAVAAAGSNYIWAVGHEEAGTDTYTARWNGSAWSRVSSPNQSNSSNFLLGVAVGPGSACTNRDNGAVGYYRDTNDVIKTLILRYTIPPSCNQSP